MGTFQAVDTTQYRVRLHHKSVISRRDFFFTFFPNRQVRHGPRPDRQLACSSSEAIHLPNWPRRPYSAVLVNVRKMVKNVDFELRDRQVTCLVNVH